MRVLLGVTGSVATTVLPRLLETLAAHGHEVEVVATKSSRFFFQTAELSVKVWTDEDEWAAPYERGKPIVHIALRTWADLLLIAPLSANTLAKLSNGLSDNLLTSVFRAWDPAKAVVVAPAMNTFMWRSPLTAAHLTRLTRDFAEAGYRISVVPPVSKVLACGDEGIGAMALIDDIVDAVDRHR